MQWISCFTLENFLFKYQIEIILFEPDYYIFASRTSCVRNMERRHRERELFFPRSTTQKGVSFKQYGSFVYERTHFQKRIALLFIQVSFIENGIFFLHTYGSIYAIYLYLLYRVCSINKLTLASATSPSLPNTDRVFAKFRNSLVLRKEREREKIDFLLYCF